MQYTEKKIKELCSFQYWLGKNYNTLPTNSIEMTERAVKFIEESKLKTKPKPQKNYKDNRLLIGVLSPDRISFENYIFGLDQKKFKYVQIRDEHDLKGREFIRIEQTIDAEFMPRELFKLSKTRIKKDVK